MSGGFESARAVADTVLFEGYVLYPYRASARKNQLRWQFGVLAPPGAGEDEPHSARTECLVETGDAAAVDVRVRFLQVRARSGGADGPDWDEAEVREIDAAAGLDLAELERRGQTEVGFTVPGGDEVDGDVRHRSWPLAGVVRIGAERFDGPYPLVKLGVSVENTTPPGDDGAAAHDADRQAMLRRSLVSCHTLLAATDGEFVSLLEPPEWARPAAQSCQNRHTWPVLVGERDRRDIMLSSPIILYDHPELATQSPGDLYDATEIDEILTLRTMTLTDSEKQEARATDPRAAEIIDRADHLPPEMLDRLHGTLRYLQEATGANTANEPAGAHELTAMTEPIAANGPVGTHGEAGEPTAVDAARPGAAPWWDPGADASVCPESDSVAVPGGTASRGSKVRLHPGTRSADIQDMFVVDRVAVVEAVLFDVDGSTHLAVTLEDDPAAELHRVMGRFRYFAPDEVELEAP